MVEQHDTGKKRSADATPAGEPATEDDFVAHFLAPLATGHIGALSLKDDAAILTPKPGTAYVLTCDTLIQDRHFLFDGSPGEAADVAHKALAVNVSDLAAKGARPHTYLMSLQLPQQDYTPWMRAFIDELAVCQRRWGLSLIGGDTVRAHAPFAITITAIGIVPDNGMIPRAGAKPGDDVYVTGTIGDGWLGLKVCSDGNEQPRWRHLIGDDAINALAGRYRRPQPRYELVDALQAHAHAAIDISDGFVRDLLRMCKASGVGTVIEATSIPLSKPACALLNSGMAALEDLFTGGDDYELIVCVPPTHQAEFGKKSREAGVAVTKVGTITREPKIRILDRNGTEMTFNKTGWDHLGDEIR